MKRFIFTLFFLSTPIMAESLSQTQLRDAEYAAKQIVHQATKDANNEYWILTRSSVSWFGFTLYTCARANAIELLEVMLGKNLTTYEIANMVTPNGWKQTWLKNPWGNAPPENTPTWCWQ